MIPLLAAISFLHGGPVAHTNSRPESHRRFGVWTLQTRSDPFRGGVTCRLSASRMRVERGVVIVHLSPRVDTSDAVYRLDGAAPVAVRSETMDMARRGFAIDQDELANPSGGLVRVPAVGAASATIVEVESGPNRHPTRFALGGLAAALDAARSASCPLIADPPQPSPEH